MAYVERKLDDHEPVAVFPKDGGDLGASQTVFTEIHDLALAIVWVAGRQFLWLADLFTEPRAQGAKLGGREVGPEVAREEEVVGQAHESVMREKKLWDRRPLGHGGLSWKKVGESRPYFIT